VEGNFPKGFKFRSEIGDKHIRKIKEQGGKVVIVRADYTSAELDDARRHCKDETSK